MTASQKNHLPGAASNINQCRFLKGIILAISQCMLTDFFFFWTPSFLKMPDAGEVEIRKIVIVFIYGKYQVSSGKQ